jgi:hypothetical protein
MAIDPETRDVVHNIYLPRVEKVNGLYGYFGLVRLCRLGHDVPWVKA